MQEVYANAAYMCLCILIATSFAFAQEEGKELEKELARELEATQQSQTEKSQPRPGRFQNMNPNISVIGTGSGGYSSLDALDRNVNMGFDEAEFSFQAAVDPYAKADFFVGFHRHEAASVQAPGADEVDGEAHEEGGFQPELEEAYLTLLSLPASLQLKMGKFRSRFGKINETHPHAWDFVDAPLMYADFLGADGLNDQGLSLSWLLPNKAFFQDLTVQVTAGPDESPSFALSETNRMLYLAHLKNFFDLSDNTTLELGLTGVTGANSPGGDVTNIFSADFTLKWKPLRLNRYKSFQLMSEFLVSQQKGDEQLSSYGMYAFLRYQLAKRWFVGAIYDYSEFPGVSDFHHQALSGILQFFATEFQKVDIQLKRNNGNFFDPFIEAKVRAVFVIGAHGAHQY